MKSEPAEDTQIPLLPLHASSESSAVVAIEQATQPLDARAGLRRYLIRAGAVCIAIVVARVVVTAILRALYDVPHSSRPSTFTGQRASDPHAISTAMPAYGRPTCPSISDNRYMALRDSHQAIYIAADLYNSEAVLGTWMRELPRFLRYVGGSNVHIAIYESSSTDRTPELLRQLAARVDRLGASFSITALGKSAGAPADRTAASRVPRLVELRNQLIEPLRNTSIAIDQPFDHVLWLNDVYFCATDLLELVLQKATMVCASDYVADDSRNPPRDSYEPYAARLYDHWVLRVIDGDFFYSGHDMFNWGAEPMPLHTRPDDRTRWRTYRPVQALSCWNGAVAIDPHVFLPPIDLRFRSWQNASEQSECTLFSLDLWQSQLGRILITPRVKLTYALPVWDVARSLERIEHGGRPIPTNDTFAADELIGEWVEPNPEFVSTPGFDGRAFWAKWSELLVELPTETGAPRRRT